MKIIRTEGAGFCFGVKRALRLAFAHVKQGKEDVYTLGPLIHNPQVCKELEKKGVKSISSLDEVAVGSKIILRSHGVPKEIYTKAVESGLIVVDAACPNVKRIQKLAWKLKEEGYIIVVIGERYHPEIVSISDTCAIVIETPDEVERMPYFKKIGLLAQTTQTSENFREAIRFLSTKITDELRVYNTICQAAENIRQASLEVAKTVDVMLVVGGKNSANTSRLAVMCSKIVKTYHIETPDEISPSWFTKKICVGLTGGTSTPTWIIEEVASALNAMGN